MRLAFTATPDLLVCISMLILRKKKGGGAADFAKVKKFGALRLPLKLNNSVDTAGFLYSRSTLFELGVHQNADYCVCAAKQRRAAEGKICKSETWLVPRDMSSG